MVGPKIGARFLCLLNKKNKLVVNELSEPTERVKGGIMFECIEYEKENFLGTITIQRPKALNALNSQVLAELNICLDHIEKDKELRAVLITGAGEKAFVAGADIKEIQSLGEEGSSAFAAKGQKLFRRFEILSLPVLAAVNGFALGGGLELAMSCDFIYASENARFGLPEVGLGIMPGFGGTVRLSRYVGMAKAKELSFSAKHISAQEAREYGLVNEVFATQEELYASSKMILGKIAQQGPIAVTACKGSIQQSFDMSIDEAMMLERRLFSELFHSEDMAIGLNAFINKEKPIFKGE